MGVHEDLPINQVPVHHRRLLCIHKHSVTAARERADTRHLCLRLTVTATVVTPTSKATNPTPTVTTKVPIISRAVAPIPHGIANRHGEQK